MMEKRVYILAGGRSQRFGTDKARQPVEGEAWLARQTRQWRELDFEVIAVGSHSGQYDDLGVPTIADAAPHLGPLSGLEAALADAARLDRHTWIWMSCCDLWTVRNEWLETLDAAKSESGWGVLFYDQLWQPFPGLYSVALLPTIQVQLAQGIRSLQRSLNLVEDKLTRRSLAGLPPIHQANTPEELAQLWNAGESTGGSMGGNREQVANSESPLSKRLTEE